MGDVDEQALRGFGPAMLEISLQTQCAVGKLLRFDGLLPPLLGMVLIGLQRGAVFEPHFAHHKTLGMEFG